MGNTGTQKSRTGLPVFEIPVYWCVKYRADRTHAEVSQSALIDGRKWGQSALAAFARGKAGALKLYRRGTATLDRDFLPMLRQARTEIEGVVSD